MAVGVIPNLCVFPELDVKLVSFLEQKSGAVGCCIAPLTRGMLVDNQKNFRALVEHRGEEAFCRGIGRQTDVVHSPYWSGEYSCVCEVKW